MILMSKKHLIYIICIILLGSFFLFWFNLDAIRATAASYLNEGQKQKIREIFHNDHPINGNTTLVITTIAPRPPNVSDA